MYGLSDGGSIFQVPGEAPGFARYMLGSFPIFVGKGGKLEGEIEGVRESKAEGKARRVLRVLHRARGENSENVRLI